ncbi:MAG: hypothetical protein KDE03_17830 [Rhodobacteraceae bacterium]|nr:hypothetical protein [Paracoccaceae bacterium]
MKKIQKTTAEESFMKSANVYAMARREFNHKKSNPAFDKMMRSARDIRLSHADGGKAFFTEIIADSRSEIVFCAAFILIPLDPELARRTLKGLSNDNSTEVKVGSKITLEEWEKGTLDVDWYMVDPST